MNTMNQNKSIAAYTLYSIVSRGGKSARMKRSPCENIYICTLTYLLTQLFTRIYVYSTIQHDTSTSTHAHRNNVQNS